MKQALLTFLSAILFLSTQAQITIDSSDIGNVGDKIYFGSDTVINGVTMSAGSAMAQTWDFSAVAQDELDSIVFVDPSATTNGAFFPAADMALEGDGTFSYFIKSNTSFSITGEEEDIQGFILPLKLEPAQPVVTFPSTYGTTFSEVSVIDSTAEDNVSGFFDSLRIKRIITTTAEIDAFGSLTTPNGTYPDVIRQATTIESVDTVWGYNILIGSWSVIINTSETDYSYQFYANGKNFFVADMGVDALGGNIQYATYQVGDKPAASGTITDASCFGANDGFVSQEILGGNPPYTYQWSNGGTSKDMGGLTAGTYTVTVYDQSDSTVMMYTIAEPTDFSISSTVADETFGTDGSISLSVSGATPNYAYEWSNGETTAVIESLVAGPYTVTITDANNCEAIETYQVGNNTSILTLDNAVTISLYPNPVEHTLNLSSSENLIHVRVVTMLGNEVLNWSGEQQQIRLNTSTLASGVYLIEATTQTGKITERILKQ